MKEDQLVFENRAAFRKWLVENHQKNPGIWIDGQIKSLGADKYIKRFTPRRKASVWSERNRKLAEKLTKDGLMTAAGQDAIEEARRKGTWDRPKPERISEAQINILTKALSGSPKALANFLGMSPSVRRTYAGFYLEAKAEDTRRRRLARIVERLNENKKPM